MVENEVDLWMLNIIKRDWEKSSKLSEQPKTSVAPTLAQRLTGIGISEAMVEETLLKLHLKADKPLSWGPGALESFVRALRERNKPSLIAANKADLPSAAEKLPRASGVREDRRPVRGRGGAPPEEGGRSAA